MHQLESMHGVALRVINTPVAAHPPKIGNRMSGCRCEVHDTHEIPDEPSVADDENDDALNPNSGAASGASVQIHHCLMRLHPMKLKSQTLVPQKTTLIDPPRNRVFCGEDILWFVSSIRLA